MNLRSLSVFLVFLAFTTIILAQNTWVPGYIITLEGDTIYGDLEVRSPGMEAYSCSFRFADDRGSNKYLPDELLGYRFEDGRFFVSRSIENTNSGHPVFLEFIVAGKLNIYHLPSTGEQSRYFAETDSHFLELKQSEIDVRINNSPYLMSRKEYVGALNYLLQDAAMENEIQNSALSPNSLIKISMEYQKRVCPEEDCIIYTREMEKINYVWSISLNLNTQSLSFGNIVNSDSRSVFGFNARVEAVDFLPFRSNISLLTGIHVNFINSHHLYAGEFYTDIFYNGDKIQLIKDYDSQHISFGSNIDMQTVMVGIPFIARYRFFSGRVQPYASVGLEASMCVSQNDKVQVSWFSNRFDKSIPFFNLGYFFGVGTSIGTFENRSIFLEANYYRSQNLDINEFYRLTLERFSFSIGYEF